MAEPADGFRRALGDVERVKETPTGLSFVASASRPALSEISLEVHGLDSKVTSSEKPIFADTRPTGATVGE